MKKHTHNVDNNAPCQNSERSNVAMTTPDGSKQYCTMVEWLKNKNKFLEENAEDYELSE